MKVTSVQPTPNPNAFKFLVDRTLVETGVRNYTKPTEATGDPLAAAIFGIQDVDTVFLCENFVTVSMLPSADWRSVHDAVVKLLEAHDDAALQPDAAPAGAAASATAPASGDGDPKLLADINELLDDRVRPALAGDGGGLEIMSLEGKTLRIRYQGACGSCPSSVAGTLHAIQNLIQSEIDEDVEVVSV
ncbi:MAG: NifU family protein [Planctomycetota bacterium]